MSPLLADFTHARVCKPFCQMFLTLPTICPGIYAVLDDMQTAKGD